MRRQLAEEHSEFIDSEDNAKLKQNVTAEIFWMKMKNVTALGNFFILVSLKRLKPTEERSEGYLDAKKEQRSFAQRNVDLFINNVLHKNKMSVNLFAKENQE